MFFQLFEVGVQRVVQETGFSKHLPCGLGLIAVNNCEGAAAAIGYVCQDYDKHAKAAREIAAEYFTPESVVGKIIDTL